MQGLLSIGILAQVKLRQDGLSPRFEIIYRRLMCRSRCQVCRIHLLCVLREFVFHLSSAGLVTYQRD